MINVVHIFYAEVTRFISNEMLILIGIAVLVEWSVILYKFEFTTIKRFDWSLLLVMMFGFVMFDLLVVIADRTGVENIRLGFVALSRFNRLFALAAFLHLGTATLVRNRRATNGRGRIKA